jgi:hypothetical protein
MTFINNIIEIANRKIINKTALAHIICMQVQFCSLEYRL